MDRRGGGGGLDGCGGGGGLDGRGGGGGLGALGRYRLGWAAAALALAGLLAPAAQAVGSGPGTAATTGTVHQSGRWLLDGSGRVLLGHGLNLVVKHPPYTPASVGFDDDDAAFLAAHGFTLVRLGVLLEALEPAPGRYDDGYLDSIAATVAILGRHGIRSLLDFHQDLYTERYQGEGFPAWMAIDDGLPAQPQAGFPGNYFVQPAVNRAFDHFWADAPAPDGVGLQEHFIAAWQHVAARFRGDPAVLGYDIFNEPWPGSVWPTCFPPLGCPAFEQGQLAAFTRRTVAALHATDPTHVAFYEPQLAFDYAAPTYLGDVGPDTAMSFHAYCLAAVGAPETPPTRAACDDVEGRTFDNAEAQAQAGGGALLLSEFGATDDTAELNAVIRQADAHRVPWTEWAYCACGDPTGSGSAEDLVHDPSRPPTGANVVTGTLDALDEPHPQAVAGTPLGYGYDPASRTFRLTYLTGSRPTTAETAVWTSPTHYPSGYTVRVTGATVVSAPGAATLLLRAGPGPHRVTVVLSPR